MPQIPHTYVAVSTLVGRPTISGGKIDPASVNEFAQVMANGDGRPAAPAISGRQHPTALRCSCVVKRSS